MFLLNILIRILFIVIRSLLWRALKSVFAYGSKFVPFLKDVRERILYGTLFLSRYYRLSNLVWHDGFLIDFVQKKSVDKVIRKFLIIAGYLFSDRLVFDRVVKFYSDTVLWLSHRQSIYDFNNIANTIFVLMFVIVILFLTITLLTILFSNYL